MSLEFSCFLYYGTLKLLWILKNSLSIGVYRKDEIGALASGLQVHIKNKIPFQSKCFDDRHVLYTAFVCEGYKHKEQQGDLLSWE